MSYAHSSYAGHGKWPRGSANVGIRPYTNALAPYRGNMRGRGHRGGYGQPGGYSGHHVEHTSSTSIFSNALDALGRTVTSIVSVG